MRINFHSLGGQNGHELQGINYLAADGDREDLPPNIDEQCAAEGNQDHLPANNGEQHLHAAEGDEWHLPTGNGEQENPRTADSGQKYPSTADGQQHPHVASTDDGQEQPIDDDQQPVNRPSATDDSKKTVNQSTVNSEEATKRSDLVHHNGEELFMDEDSIRCQSSSVDQTEAEVTPSNLKAETVE